MTELRFDPESAHKGQKKIYAALIDMQNAVERPLRNVALPEMPAGVRGSVEAGIASAIATMADARVAVASVAREIKFRAQNLGVYDKAAEMSKWWTLGDVAISLTGGDAFYKSFGGLDVTDPNWNPLEGKFGGWQHTDYSAKDQALAWGSFALNFVGGPIIKGAAKGGRRLLSLGRARRAENTADALAASRVAGEGFSAQQLSDAWTHRLTMGRTKYGPANPGPLPEYVMVDGRKVQIAEGFRSSTYEMVVERSDTLLYRVHGPGGELGSWWTRNPPRGPLQARLDAAILPEWGNPMTEITVIRVPKGEAFFEGAVAGQTSTKPGTAFGGDPSYLPGGQMVGGGTQVYVPHVPDAWKVPLQHARPH